MKFSGLHAVVLATLRVAIASPVASPDAKPVPAPAPAPANTSQIMAGWPCTLHNPAPGSGSIPCRSGANTGYSVVVYYPIGWDVDVYCKANGGTYNGASVWDYIDRGGNNCWLSAYHTNPGCERPVRWC